MGYQNPSIDEAVRDFVTVGIPGTGPANVSKALVRKLFRAIEADIAALQSSILTTAIAAETWNTPSTVRLDQIEGSRVGDFARITNDGGSHTDPVKLTSVQNEGLYSWHTTEVWTRIGSDEVTELAEALSALNDYADDMSTKLGRPVPVGYYRDKVALRFCDGAGHLFFGINRDGSLVNGASATTQGAVAGWRAVPVAGYGDKIAVKKVDGSGRLYEGTTRDLRKIFPATALPVDGGAPMVRVSSGDIIITEETGDRTIDLSPYTALAAQAHGKAIKAAVNKPGYGANGSYLINTAGNFLVDCTPNTLNVIIGMGQSLQSGSQGVPVIPVLTERYADHILMPDTGPYSDVRLNLNPAALSPNALDPDSIVGFRPLASRVNAVAYLSGQTPLESMARRFADQCEAQLGFMPRVCCFSVGHGGMSYTQLKKGTQAHTNMLAAVTKIKALAAARGWTTVVRVFEVDHGEADQSNASYYANQVEWQTDCNTDVKAITSQACDIPFINQAPSHFLDTADKSVLAMLKLHTDNPTTHVLSHPVYPLPLAADGIHCSPEGYVLLGEYKADAFMGTPHGLGQYQCVRPLSAVRSGLNIDLTCSAPSPLTVDTGVSVRASTVRGMEYVPNSGSPVLQTVDMLSDYVIRLAFDTNPPAGKIRYALKGYSTFTPINPLERPRGSIRTSAGVASLVAGVTRRHWLVPFEFTVS